MRAVKAMAGLTADVSGSVSYRDNVDIEGAFTFYANPPEGEIRLAQLDQLVRLRLKLLQVIDRKASSITENGSVSLEIFGEQEASNVLAMIPPLFRESADAEITSHFISRLAFSRSQEFADWFVRCEELLFFSKVKQGGMEAVSNVLKQTGLSRIIREITGPDHADFDSIRKATPSGESASFFYVVKFTDCPAHLIARRAVVIRKGWAYLPDTEMPVMLTKKFKDFLLGAMSVAQADKAQFMADERVAAVFKNIGPTAQTQKKSYGHLNGADKLTLGNFHVAFQRSFPPCMRLPIEWMREKKTRLKNSGRNMLAPFLRSAGFSLEDSLSWWKKEFLRDSSVDNEKFEKNYTYNIKWVYGKAGRMKPALPMSCTALIAMEFPSADQSHGCPFKVLEEPALAILLKKWAVSAGMQEGSMGWVRDVLNKATKSKSFIPG